jgi:hypothetical protein
MESTIDQSKLRSLVERAKREKMTSEEFQKALDELLKESPEEADQSMVVERIRETAHKARQTLS